MNTIINNLNTSLDRGVEQYVSKHVVSHSLPINGRMTGILSIRIEEEYVECPHGTLMIERVTYKDTLAWNEQHSVRYITTTKRYGVHAPL